MADRLIKVLENNQYVTRGASDMGRHVQFELDNDETLTLTVDWTGWLASETIASSENKVTGPTVGAISTDAGVSTFTVSGGPGWIQHRLTTSGGQTKELRIRVVASEPIYRDDYGWMKA